jgi:hypothetical protein
MDFRLLAKLVDIVKLNQDESPVELEVTASTAPVNVTTSSTTEFSEIEELLTTVTTVESIVTRVQNFLEQCFAF